MRSLLVCVLLNFLFTSAYGIPAKTTASVCKLLDEEYGEIITLANEQNYVYLRTQNWQVEVVQTAWSTPTCIFRPKILEQLQRVLRILVNATIPFAIRSGGHSPHHNWANIDDGVLIDLSNFKRLDYDAGSNFAIVGAGLTWGEVYTELEKHSAVAVGGRLSDVGVSGLALGTCDNVLNFQVVLGDGSVVDANAETNPELFWALKGGSNNFGIVTEFKLRTYPLGQVWGGIKTYSLEQLPEVVRAYTQYQSAHNKSSYGNLIVGVSPTNSSIGVLVSMVYLKPEENPTVFTPFYSISAISDTTGMKSFTTYMAEYSVPVIPRFDWHAISFELHEGLYDDVTKFITSTPSVDAIRNATGSFMAVTLQPISSRVAELGESTHGNALGLSPVTQTWLAIATGWLYQEDDKKVHEAARAAIDQIADMAKSRGKYLPYIFMNDASWDQNVLAGYGEENVKRLRQISGRYDPTSVFQELVPGGFKLT